MAKETNEYVCTTCGYVGPEEDVHPSDGGKMRPVGEAGKDEPAEEAGS